MNELDKAIGDYMEAKSKGPARLKKRTLPTERNLPRSSHRKFLRQESTRISNIARGPLPKSHIEHSPDAFNGKPGPGSYELETPQSLPSFQFSLVPRFPGLNKESLYTTIRDQPSGQEIAFTQKNKNLRQFTPEHKHELMLNKSRERNSRYLNVKSNRFRLKNERKVAYTNNIIDKLKKLEYKLNSKDYRKPQIAWFVLISIIGSASTFNRSLPLQKASNEQITAKNLIWQSLLSKFTGNSKQN